MLENVFNVDFNFVTMTVYGFKFYIYLVEWLYGPK